MDKTFIKDLLVRGIIGIRDWEREKPQDILINITAITDTSRAAQSDNITDCVDYSALAKKVQAHAETSARFTVEALANDLGARAVAHPVAADLLVNCTSVGLEGHSGASGVERSATEDRALNQLGLTGDQVGEYSNVIDLVYHSQPTALLAAAGARGARTVDGLQVLVAQGALSFELWTGRDAPRELMARAARAEEPAPD